MTEKPYAKGMNLFSTRDCLQMDLDLETVDDSVVPSARLSVIHGSSTSNALANSRSRERRREVCQSASRSIRKNEWGASRIQNTSVKNPDIISNTVIVEESDEQDSLPFKYSRRRNKALPINGHRSSSPEDIIMKIDEDRESSQTIINAWESAVIDNDSSYELTKEKEKQRDEKNSGV